MSDDTEQLHVKVNSDLKRRAKAKLPHGGLSEQVRRTLQRVVDGNAERIQLRNELTELRDEREQLKQERAALDRQISDIERKIERKEEKLEQYDDPDTEYKGRLGGILDHMEENGLKMDPGHPKVTKAAQIYGKEPVEVVKDLQELNEDLPESRFKETESVSR